MMKYLILTVYRWAIILILYIHQSLQLVHHASTGLDPLLPLEFMHAGNISQSFGPY